MSSARVWSALALLGLACGAMASAAEPVNRCEQLRDLARAFQRNLSQDFCEFKQTGSELGQAYRSAPQSPQEMADATVGRQQQALRDLEQLDELLQNSAARTTRLSRASFVANRVGASGTLGGLSGIFLFHPFLFHSDAMIDHLSHYVSNAPMVAVLGYLGTVGFATVGGITSLFLGDNLAFQSYTERTALESDLTRCFFGELRSQGLAVNGSTVEEKLAWLRGFVHERTGTARELAEAERAGQRGRFASLWRKLWKGAGDSQCRPEPVSQPASSTTGVRVAVDAPAPQPGVAAPQSEEHEEPAARPGAGAREDRAMCSARPSLPIEIPSSLRALMTPVPGPVRAPAQEPVSVAQCNATQVRQAALPIFAAAMSRTHGVAFEHLAEAVAAPALVLGAPALASAGLGEGSAAAAAGAGRVFLRLAPRLAAGGAGGAGAVLAYASGALASEQPLANPLVLNAGASSQCVVERESFCSTLRSLVSEPGQACANAAPQAGVWEMGPQRCYDAATALNQALQSPSLMCEAIPVED